MSSTENKTLENIINNVDKNIINKYLSIFSEKDINIVIKDVVKNIYDNNISDAILMHGEKNIAKAISNYFLQQIEYSLFLKIHPVKRDKVKKGCEYIKQYPFVKKMIIFGSAVTKTCTEESDIDICLVINKDKNQKEFVRMYGELPLYMDELCDILIYDKLNDEWKKQIDEKGVIVYES